MFRSTDMLWEDYRGWSPYAYSMNNPLRLKDPSGYGPKDASRIQPAWTDEYTGGVVGIGYRGQTTGRSGSQIIGRLLAFVADAILLYNFSSDMQEQAANEKNKVKEKEYKKTEVKTPQKNDDEDDEVPQKAKDVVEYAKQKNGAARPGYKGNRTYSNDGRDEGEILPQRDANGNPITYKEYDVNPFQKGVNRGAERVVIGSDGKAYYTNDHYRTFQEIQP